VGHDKGWTATEEETPVLLPSEITEPSVADLDRRFRFNIHL